MSDALWLRLGGAIIGSLWTAYTFLCVQAAFWNTSTGGGEGFAIGVAWAIATYTAWRLLRSDTEDPLPTVPDGSKVDP